MGYFPPWEIKNKQWGRKSLFVRLFQDAQDEMEFRSNLRFIRLMCRTEYFSICQEVNTVEKGWEHYSSWSASENIGWGGAPIFLLSFKVTSLQKVFQGYTKAFGMVFTKLVWNILILLYLPFTWIHLNLCIKTKWTTGKWWDCQLLEVVLKSSCSLHSNTKNSLHRCMAVKVVLLQLSSSLWDGHNPHEQSLSHFTAFSWLILGQMICGYQLFQWISQKWKPIHPFAGAQNGQVLWGSF